MGSHVEIEDTDATTIGSDDDDLDGARPLVLQPTSLPVAGLSPHLIYTSISRHI